MNNNEFFKEKIVVILGGANNIGRKIVESFAEKGETVIFTDIDKDKSNELIKKAETKKWNVRFIFTDISEENQMKDLVKNIINSFGRIDILINNIRGKRNDLPSFEYSLDEWAKQFSTILGGNYLACKYFLPEMIKAKKGTILNITSISANLISNESLEYHIAKAGLVQFTKYIANKYGKFNIRANCISPGLIIKDQHIEKFNSNENKKYKETAIKCHPINKIGLTEDIANAAVFLCSESAGFITGHELIIDGGLTTHDPWALINNLDLSFKENEK